MNEKLKNSIRILAKVYYDYQRERISLCNRLGMKKNGNAKKKTPERDEEFLKILFVRLETIEELENNVFKEIAKEVHKHPLWKEFLVEVKGCGETMAAIIISEFDINIAETVSKMWAFSGLVPGRDKKKKGEKCPYNQFLKSKLCGVLGSGFLKANSPYREFYDNIKHRYESENWGVESKNPVDKKRPKAGHQHNASIRYMVKMFLKDLYVAWRTLEGLPVREPYAEEYLGKVHSG